MGRATSYWRINMASEKISQLTPHTPNAADLIPVADGGANFSDTVGNIEAQAAALVVNITGTAAGLSGTPALPNGTTGTTQTTGDNTTKLATDAFVHASIAAIPAETWAGLTGNLTETQVIPFDGPTPGTADTSIWRSAANTVSIGLTGSTPDASGNVVAASYTAGVYSVTSKTSITEGVIELLDTLNPKIYLHNGIGITLSSDRSYGWSAVEGNVYPADTSLSRASANIVQIGNTGGTPDASGTLKCATLIEGSTLTPASATTAGVTGQIAWQGTNGTTGQIFICTSGGSAGSAIWMAATLAKV
jgi:hypothetical protein